MDELNSSEFAFNHLFSREFVPLDPLDIDFTDNNPPQLNYQVPSINVNRSNSIPSQPTIPNWQPTSPVQRLSPMQTDVQEVFIPPFSTPSHSSDSSYGCLSPCQMDPLTPSPTSPRERSYATIRSPESAAGRFHSQSPATGTLGLSVCALSLLNDWRKCAV
jgi:hypothetical protein